MPDALKNPINALAGVSIGAEGPNFGLSLHLHSNLAYANSEGSGESAHLRRLAEHSLFNNAISTDVLCAGSFFS